MWYGHTYPQPLFACVWWSEDSSRELVLSLSRGSWGSRTFTCWAVTLPLKANFLNSGPSPMLGHITGYEVTKELAIVKGFWIHSNHTLIQNQTQNKYEVSLATLIHVVSCDSCSLGYKHVMCTQCCHHDSWCWAHHTQRSAMSCSRGSAPLSSDLR